MGLTSFFKVIIDPSRSRSSSSWVRSPCSQPRTLSFRLRDEDVYKTVNSIYFDPADQLPDWSPQKAEEGEHEEEDDVTCYVVTESFSSVSKEEESVMQGLRSDRMFFERGGETSSIVLLEATTTDADAGDAPVSLVNLAGDEEDLVPFKESVAEEMESENPYMDFRISMEQMVISHGLKDWECLEKLLEWYLRMNMKKTHGFIVGAFVDLLLDLATYISSSPASSSPSSCLCTSTTSSSSSSSSSLTTTTTTTTTATTTTTTATTTTTSISSSTTYGSSPGKFPN